MPQHRPPRVISQPTPLRVVGVGENPRQGARRGVDLHVARSLTVGRFPPAGAGLPTRCRRSTRRGGDRHRSGRGGQQKRGVVHSHWHGDVPYPSTCFARHAPSPAALELPSATYQPLHVPGRVHRHHVDRTLYGQDQIFQRGRPYVFNAGISWNRLASRYPWYLLASRTHCRRPFHLVLQVVIPMLDSSSVQNGSMSMRLQAHRFAGTSCRGGTSAMSRASAIRSG
jgi:hypothetical protein